MKEIVLEKSAAHADLFPFTLNRSEADIRVGILTIREKWELLFGLHTSREFNGQGANRLVVPANLLPDEDLVRSVQDGFADGQTVPAQGRGVQYLQNPWDIFQLNDLWIRRDFELLTRGRQSQPISGTNRLEKPEQIFLEPGAKVEHAVLNASTGPIYIGKNAHVMEGALIRGPFALGVGSLVKMGAIIYGATTIGPGCVVGGEIKNSVLFGYSNKAHQGYLGDAVIGEYCNLGAGSSNSNLKNNLSEVQVWNENKQAYLPAGIKCGLFMGDFSRSAINTSFVTGAVVGLCCNIFGLGLTPKYMPSFSWGYGPRAKYALAKALHDVGQWKKLKNQELTEDEIRTLTHIFEQS
jgi:UDP-N-acetylglucosamine diphosphorylase / glucose-1-phosphate thymidylyltransferase / UDP-N-acetylgalactosamine diphosphorylase / glucosamine-1-phosphate N-acetyltransferase / galactosamine-1-phosphate N-acetyltransferase